VQGVVKALFQQDLLPRVISGSSVGSIGELVTSHHIIKRDRFKSSQKLVVVATMRPKKQAGF